MSILCLLILIFLDFSLVSSFPNVPFTTESRWIKDSTGAVFTYAGVNWPGAAEVMIPEGLQYQSVQTIVSKIKSAGFNAIRLTFATEMIDQMLANGGVDISIKAAFIDTLGVENGTATFNQAIRSNPSWTDGTTRLQVFDAVANECAKQRIYVHLDNHMSKGEWCCSFTDGNTWFGDQYFDIGNWTRGLTFMASRAASWPSFVSIGLRNELRPPVNNVFLLPTYNWKTWYNNMVAASDAVHIANPNALIFFGGINSDTYLRPIPLGSDLGDGVSFNKSSFAYSNKLVLELHKYDNSEPVCEILELYLDSAGFAALQTDNPDVKNVMPLVMSEFGYAQDLKTVDSVYATCIRNYILKNKAGWMVWTISGSYYIRQGQQDSDETYGLLNHDWSDYRSYDVFKAGIGPMINESLSLKESQQRISTLVSRVYNSGYCKHLYSQHTLR